MGLLAGARRLTRELDSRLISRSRLAATVTAIVYTSCVLLLLPRRFETNDNSGMLAHMLAREEVPFMSPALGGLLTALYAANGTIPWFPLTSYLAIGISLFLFLHSGLRLEVGLPFKCAFVLLLLCYYFRFVMHADFTVASLLLGCSAVIAFVVAAQIGRSSWQTALALGLVLCFSWGLRPAGVKGALVFTIPLLVWGVLKHWRVRWKEAVLLLAPYLALSGTFVLSSTLTHQGGGGKSSDQNAFEEWNALRSRFHGYPVAELNVGNEKILKANDWTRNDYELLRHWAFLDERKFNVRTMRNVFKHSIVLPAEALPSRSDPRLSRTLLQTYEQQGKYIPIYALVLVAAVLMLGAKRALPCIFFATWAVGASLLMGVLMRLPARVGFPTTLSVAVGVALTIFVALHQRRDQIMRWSSAARRRIVLSLGVLALACIVLQIRSVLQLASHNRSRQAQLERRFQRLSALNARLLVTQPTQSGGQYQDPLHRYEYDYVVVPMGWHIFSPIFYERIAKVHLRKAYEVLPEVVRNGRAFIVSDKKFVRRLVTYLGQTHGLHCRPIAVKKILGNQYAFRLERIS